jgi:hypothetical protein
MQTELQTQKEHTQTYLDESMNFQSQASGLKEGKQEAEGEKYDIMTTIN